MRTPSPIVAVVALFLAPPGSAQQWTSTFVPIGRTFMSAAAVDDLALFAGGSRAGVPSAIVDVYDQLTGTWSSAALSVARFNMGAASAGSCAVFAGGDLSNNLTSDVVDIYDAATNTWSTSALSTPRRNLVGVAHGTKVYFAGGYGSDAVDIYDTATGLWSFDNLSAARGDLAAAAVGTKVLFAGGWAGAGSDIVDIYDTATGTWTVATLSQARDRLAATTLGTKVIFAGGGDASLGIYDHIDIYDDATGQWTTATLSRPRELMGAATVGDYAVFAGGYDGVSLTAVATVDVYEGATGLWSTASLSAARWGIAATTVGDCGLFGGGGGDSRVIDLFCVGIGTRYCSPIAPNSTGVPGVMQAQGSAAVAQNNLRLSASRLPQNAFGFFIASRMQGFVANPGGSTGNLCLSGSIGRFQQQVQSSGATGRIEIVANLTAFPSPSGAPTSVQPGETWNFQLWHRDVAAGATTSNFTQALSVPFH